MKVNTELFSKCRTEVKPDTARQRAASKLLHALHKFLQSSGWRGRTPGPIMAALGEHCTELKNLVVRLHSSSSWHQQGLRSKGQPGTVCQEKKKGEKIRALAPRFSSSNWQVLFYLSTVEIDENTICFRSWGGDGSLLLKRKREKEETSGPNLNWSS